MNVDNVVLGDDIKSLIFSYKKGYLFIPSKNYIVPHFHDYLDYKYTYMQFGVQDKIPNTFKTNEGYKLYGPHKRELYDRIVNEMSLGGLILYLNEDKLVEIEEDNIWITTKYFKNHIKFKNLHVYNVGDSITDFSSLKKERSMIYDWYSTENLKNRNSYEMIFIRDHRLFKRIMLVQNERGGTDILVISKFNPKFVDPDKFPITSNVFDLYEILQSYGISCDLEPMLRENYNISRNVILKNSKNICAPNNSMYKLLRLGANKRSNLWSIKKSLMGVKIPETDETARTERKLFNLSYEPVH